MEDVVEEVVVALEDQATTSTSSITSTTAMTAAFGIEW